MNVNQALIKALKGERISSEDALWLHQHCDLATLAFLADEVRSRKHPTGVVSYIVDRNLNPTNVCVTDCGFCAFYAKPNDLEKSYVLDRETIYAKVQETVDLGGVQILMQGGHHPKLGIEWYEELLTDLKTRWPELHLHALSPPEVDHISKVSKLSTLTVLQRLKAAGMDSIPGGGAEILTEEVRETIAPRKTDTDTWLRIMEEAHGLGLRTTATMMFGHVEAVEDRIEHLRRLRDVQDRTGGFTAFIDWTFQPGGNPLGTNLLAEGWRQASHAEYFRTTTVARIFLDNFDNFQASFVTQGKDAATLSLRMGCNDYGSAMLEENVVSSAGCAQLIELSGIEKEIVAAGFQPSQRNQAYDLIESRLTPAAQQSGQ